MKEMSPKTKFVNGVHPNNGLRLQVPLQWNRSNYSSIWYKLVTRNVFSKQYVAMRHRDYTESEINYKFWAVYKSFHRMEATAECKRFF